MRGPLALRQWPLPREGNIQDMLKDIHAEKLSTQQHIDIKVIVKYVVAAA